MKADRAPQLKAVVGRFYLGMMTVRMRIGIAAVILIGTLAIGVALAVRLFLREDPSALALVPQPVPSQAERVTHVASPDETVYQLNLCHLVSAGNRYDGKFVAMQVVYEQGKDTAALRDPRCEDLWLRPSCYSGDKSCDEIWTPLNDAILRSASWRVRIDVVGRYIADIEDPNPLQGGNHVHMFELTSLKNPVPLPGRD